MKKLDKEQYDDVKLEWYVLNEDNYRTKEEFNRFPYSFHETKVRPWNVFNNWPFKHAAIDLVKGYYEGNMKNWDWCDEFPKDGTDYEKFKFNLMHELSREEHSRCEYEICVTEWPPIYLGKDGKHIHVYAGQEHEPIEDIPMDKVDCYTQVLPNADIFADYVFNTVSKVLGEA